MNLRVAFIYSLLALFITRAHAQEGHDQTLVISNLRKIKGTLFIGWYNEAGDFRKPNKSFLRKMVDVNGEESIPVVFENVPAGTYAVAVFLDQNGNGKIDTNILGIPKEKYGFSNNVYPLTRPASFKESSFVVQDKERNIVIRLK